MPTLNIGGRKVAVDDNFLSLSPEQQSATVEEISASFGPKKPTETAAGDIAKSAGSGLANAATTAAGMGGDARELVLKGAEYLGGKVFGEDRAADAMKSVRPVVNQIGRVLPAYMLGGNTSAENKAALEAVAGPEYQSQSNAGRYVKGATEFLPSALLPGGSGKVRVASALLGGLGSVGGGDIAANTLGERARPYGELGGGVLASLTPASFAKAAQVASPTAKELKTAYKAAQQSPEVQGLVFSPIKPREEVRKVLDTLEMSPNSFRERNVPETFREVREGLPGAMTFDDVNAVRKNLNDIAAKNRGKPEAAAANLAKKELDTLLENLDPSKVIFGDARAASQRMKAGNADYAAAKRSDAIEEAVVKAERKAGRAGAGQNFENALRQEISKILDSSKKVAGFSKSERETMEKIVKGSFSGNLLRHVGKLAPNGVVSTGIGGGIGAGIGAATGQDPYLSAGAALGIGGVARALSNRNTLNKVKALSETTRARSASALPGAGVPGIDPRRAAVLRALLANGGADQFAMPSMSRQSVE